MDRIELVLPREVKEEFKKEAKKCCNGNVSEYIRKLHRRDITVNKITKREFVEATRTAAFSLANDPVFIDTLKSKFKR